MTIQQALECWNTSAEKCGWPQVRLNRPQPKDRVNKLRDILATGGMEEWREALAKAEQSDFLCGRTDRSEKHAGWRFNIDTMVRPSFFTRLLEGNFDNSKPSGTIYKSPETLLWEARLRSWKPGALWLGIWGPSPLESGCQAPPSIVEEWRQRNMN